MRFIKKLKYSIFAFTIILLNIKNVFAANIFDCNSISAFGKDMQNLFDFLKVGIVLLVIGLSTYDFLKAILQKDEKDIKKAFQSLIKRLVCAAILFFLPIFLNIILYVLGITNSICIS